MDKTLTALVIGPSGHGKSWLGSTVPPPRLIIDLEGRAKFTPNGRGAVIWDGASDPMKLPKSKTRTYIVQVTDMKTLTLVRQWLRSGKHPFTSIVMDSLMEAQMRTVDDIKPGAAALLTQDWGSLLRQMESMVREFRDLTLVPETGVKVVVLIAGVKKSEDGFQRPLMQGQINTKVPYWMDLVGFLEKIRTEDGTIVRRLWIDQRPQNDLEVKDGTDAILQKFGPCIETPNFTDMYEALQDEGEGGNDE